MLIDFVGDRFVGVKQLFRFPNPVNETAARVVATGVTVTGLAFLVTGWGWLLAVLVYGFAARVLTGPTLSPLGQIATRVITPRLTVADRFVPGPPKRFAQAIGLGFSAAAGLAWLGGAPIVAYVLIAGLVVAATLESVLALCLGCIIFNRIWGCADCVDIRDRVGISAQPRTVPAAVEH